ncbi:hypothetical protein LC607_00950 [Nostoc sp. CHAB 5824]|nr:hypothetical protein [Nostoc sp. CHAB 5824]
MSLNVIAIAAKHNKTMQGLELLLYDMLCSAIRAIAMTITHHLGFWCVSLRHNTPYETTCTK